MSFVVVIPARFASTRLPGKALADIAGKPMVVRVAERARRSGAAGVWIATDHADIAAAARAHGFDAVMTRADHASGTDRIAEAVQILGCADRDVVVNVQGDEPLVGPELIGQVAAALEADDIAAVATASHALAFSAELFNPNVVKVVTDSRGYALYFSRAPIPYARDAFAGAMPAMGGATQAPWPRGLPAQRHVGLYAYRAEFLKQYARLEPSPVERFEALEQLRVLWHGLRIRVVQVEQPPEAGVDTHADLDRVRKKFDE